MIVLIDTPTAFALVALASALIFFGYAIGHRDFDMETESMSQKTRSTDKRRAILALAAAFRYAEEGQRDKAEASWHCAIKYGYIPREHTRLRFATALNSAASASPEPAPLASRVRRSGQ